MAKGKNEPNQKRWSSLKGRNSETSIKDCKIDVFEKARSLEIPENPKTSSADPYGIPITANLGISLISKFHKMIHPIARKKFLDGEYISFNNIITGKGEKQGYTIDDIEKSYNDLIDILRRSCAITIDKNVLLKTISQPGCEGVRFYLCKKRVKGTSFISLVTVGVNSEGRDHLYDYSPGLKGGDVEPKSLTTEYAHPPGSKGISGRTLREIFPDPYVLLNYAVDESKK